MEITDVVIDLETLGTERDAVVTSIGAAAFNRYGTDVLSTFAINCHIGAGNSDRSMTQDTLAFWLTKTSQEAREAMMRDTQDLEDATYAFYTWFCGLPVPRLDDLHIWGNGITFDLGILADASAFQVPWSWWNERDLRTIKDIPGVPWHEHDMELVEGLAHQAVWDAVKEAHEIMFFYNHMKDRETL